MRVAPPPPGSFSDDSDGDARAWPRAASTSCRFHASAEASDLRDMLDAAEAARAALREVASRAAAEREMAFEARDAAAAERDRLRGELEPLRASLAEATRVAARRDDEVTSLRFKLEQLLRHARERDVDARAFARRTTDTLYTSKESQEKDTYYETEETEEIEERLYVEALATVSASAELELAETRDALRDARDEAAEVSALVARTRRERDGFREEAERLRTEVKHEKALRVLEKKAHDAEMQSATRRAEKAEKAEKAFEAESQRRRERRLGASPRLEGGGAAQPTRMDAVCDATTGSGFESGLSDTPNADVDSIERNENERSSRNESSTTFQKSETNENASARALRRSVETHRRSMRAHLDALARDREMLATTT